MTNGKRGISERQTRRTAWAVWWTVIVYCWCAAAMAQPAPILRATLSTPRVVVGQPVILRIELLVPNYLTAPPAFPDFQIRNAVTRPLGNINVSEVHDGMTYAGLTHEVAIHPQEPGTYAVADQTIDVAYAADPPHKQEARLALPSLSFEAVIPDAAAGLDPFVAATRLTLRQTLDRSSGDFKVGEAVTRTVTIEADGVPAMLLPPITFSAPAGIAAYPAQPTLQDKSDRRSDAITGQRTDRVSYMLETAGDYLLPGIDVTWWNMGEQKIERSHVDPVALHVMPDPALATRTSDARTIAADALDHWPWIAAAAVAVAGLAWSAPRTIRALRDWHGRRHAAWLQSEDFMFARLRHAARQSDAAAIYFALLNWLVRFAPMAHAHTIDALRDAAQDPALDRQLAALEIRLFGAPGNEPPGYSPRKLLRRTEAARRRLRRRGVPIHQGEWPLPALNPVAPPVPPRTRRRHVAR